MKLYHWLLRGLSILVILCLAGCSKKNPMSAQPQPALTLNRQMLDFGLDVTSHTVTIKNQTVGTTLEWTLTTHTTDGRNWLTAMPVSGTVTSDSNVVTVSVNRDMTPAGDFIGYVIVNSSGGKDSVEVRMKVLAGQWLSYDDNNYEQSVDARPEFFFFLVRFDRPAGWTNYTVTKVKTRFSTSGNDSIRVLCFDTRYSTNAGNYFPSNRLYMSESLNPVSGENIFSVNWPLNLERFCAGYFQLKDYAPDLYFDTTTPQTRSYLVALQNSGLAAYLFSDANWAIQVYVERSGSPSPAVQDNTIDGQWLSPTAFKVINGTPHEITHLSESPFELRTTLRQFHMQYAK